MSPGDRPRVLLIDDSDDDRLLARRQLEKELPELDLEEIESQDELDAALEDPVDLVITDYHLGWATGTGIFELVKERSPECRVIMFTGTGSEEIAVEAMKAGLDDYVVKAPQHFIRLPAAVRLALERAEERRAMREAETRYKTLFDRVPVGLYRTTPAGAITNANTAFVKMLGYPDRERLLSTNAVSLYANPQDRARWEALMDADGRVRGFEVRLQRPDGTIVWAEENAQAVRDDDGQIVFYEGSLQDITERKELEERLQHSQRMEAIGRLAGGVAHDFNNLLTAITGYCDMALADLREDDPLQDDLVEIRKSVERATSLTRQLLAFSRRQVLEPMELQLNDVVRDMHRMLERLIGEDILLETHLSDDLENVRADRGQIEQVIMNLAVNARDAMPEGGALTIETANATLGEEYVRSRPDVEPGPYVLLAVSDAGTGMTAEQLEHIFEPFFTTKGEGEGTGLGLSTVYGIVKQSGGHIEVYSEPDRGTTFKIYLPHVTEADEPPATVADVPAADIGGTETILIVEDDESVRKLARRVLEEAGYTVLEAAHGNEALDVLERREVDLVVSDIVMPEVSARELSIEVRRRHPDVEFLYLSGYTPRALERQQIIEPGQIILQKPFTPAELRGTIRSALDDLESS